MAYKNKRRVFIIKVRVRSEIFDRVYGIEDLKNVLDLFNEIHGNQMIIEIEAVEEVKKI